MKYTRHPRRNLAPIETAVLGTAAVVLVAIVLRDPVLERWSLYVLETGDEAAKERAAGRLGELRSKRAVPHLVEFFLRSRSSNPWGSDVELHCAVRALVQIGRPAVPELLGSLALDDIGKRLQVRRALERIGRLPVPTLVQGLEHEDPRVRAFSAHALRELGPEARAAVPALVARLNDEFSAIALEAACALEATGESIAFRALARAAENEKIHAGVRRACAAAATRHSARGQVSSLDSDAGEATR